MWNFLGKVCNIYMNGVVVSTARKHSQIKSLIKLLFVDLWDNPLILSDGYAQANVYLQG